MTSDDVQSCAELNQTHLIKSIIDAIGEQKNSDDQNTPELLTRVLHAYETSEPHNQHCCFQCVIGALGFLEKSTRPIIVCAVHQCARFS
jgi:hypothetical protein